jgi:hypothetical protein
MGEEEAEAQEMAGSKIDDIVIRSHENKITVNNSYFYFNSISEIR